MHTYEYGNMGELVKKTSTGIVPVDGSENYTFATRWQYDSWNRIHTILYPDGELVEYDYDNGGQLISMQGNKATTQNYVNNIEYDEFGSRTEFEYGNGVISEYVYNSATRRLQNLTTTATNGSLHDITYTYDPVGNITRIRNTAGGADGLGGSFTYNYSYDDLYRLETSDGISAANASYTLAMEYSPSGNIIKKTLAATKEILGNGTFESYDNEYSYNGAHTLGNLTDLQGGAPGLTFNFDGNGNMVTQQLYDPNSGPNNRYLCWDEENRLSATRDNNYVTANIYDASGNRAWKIAGEMNWMWQNGSGWQGYGDLNLRTWYQSELMTITDVGFTKHYFIAGQKIASKLGEGFSNSDELNPLKGAPLAPIYSDYTELARAQVNRLQRDFDCLGVSYGNFNPGEGNIRLLDDYEVIEIGEESDIYFYHSDHLGSSSFLTDGGGVATQHLQYLPFGEDLVHQQNTAAYYTPYTFSGKERDVETGLSYFGARYYDAGLSIWLSVDPMSDKYPSLSAYNYCAWNPVMLVDPDGREWADPDSDKKIANRANRLVDAAINRLEKANQGNLNRISKIEGRSWSNERKEKKIAALNGNISENNGRISKLQGVKDDISAMESSDIKFTFRKGGDGYNEVYVQGDGTVVLPYGNDENLIHEIVHGGQVASGRSTAIPTSRDLLYNPSVLTPIDAEVEAYQAQYSFNPYTMPKTDKGSLNSLGRITPESVRGVYFTRPNVMGEFDKIYPYKKH